MNKAVFKDPIFLAGAAALVFAVGMYLSKHVSLPNFNFGKSSGSVQQFDSPPAQQKVAATPQLKATLAGTPTPSAQQIKIQQIPMHAPSQDTNQVFDVKRGRPQNEKFWVVNKDGSGDSVALDLVLANVAEGDVIRMGPGVFHFSPQIVGVKGITIEGVQGTVLSWKEGRTYGSKVGSYNLKNLVFAIPATAFYEVSGWDSHFSFENVTFRGEGKYNRMMVEGGASLRIQNCTFNNVELQARLNSTLHVESSLFDNGSEHVTVDRAKEVKIKNTVFKNFNLNAVAIDDMTSEVTIEESRFENGSAAFYSSKGGRIWGNKLKFSNLRYVERRAIKVSCSSCEQTAVERWSDD